MRCVYAGSFDMPTVGHMHVISEACKLIGPSGRLFVSIGQNPNKKCMFTETERMDMLMSIVDTSKVTISCYPYEYLANYAADIEADTIIRGIRNAQDATSELAFYDFNRKLKPSISTVLIPSPPELAVVSSSYVKNLIGPRGWETLIAQYLHPAVWKIVVEKYHAQGREKL